MHIGDHIDIQFFVNTELVIALRKQLGFGVTPPLISLSRKAFGEKAFCKYIYNTFTENAKWRAALRKCATRIVLISSKMKSIKLQPPQLPSSKTSLLL